MAASGSFASGLVFAIAGSFHLVIFPEKIPATVAGSRDSSVTPSTWKMTAIGEIYTGRFRALESAAQLANLPAPISSSLNGRSEPAKFAAPAMNAERPAPEPSGE